MLSTQILPPGQQGGAWCLPPDPQAGIVGGETAYQQERRRALQSAHRIEMFDEACQVVTAAISALMALPIPDAATRRAVRGLLAPASAALNAATHPESFSLDGAKSVISTATETLYTVNQIINGELPTCLLGACPKCEGNMTRDMEETNREEVSWKIVERCVSCGFEKRWRP